jgi:hypothetical protein
MVIVLRTLLFTLVFGEDLPRCSILRSLSLTAFRRLHVGLRLRLEILSSKAQRSGALRLPVPYV